MKAKIVSLLANHFVIALILSGTIIVFLPDFFNKNILELEKTDFYQDEHLLFLGDLDGDTISERLIVRSSSDRRASFVLHNSNNAVLDQYNFNSRFISNSPRIDVLDVDEDGFNEVYMLTHRSDSILLNIVEPMDSAGIVRLGIYVDSIPLYTKGRELDKENEIGINQFRLQDYKGGKRIVYECITGFLQYPRNIYAYDFIENKILRSEHLTNPAKITQLFDLDDDGKQELLIGTSAPDNYLRPEFSKRSDGSSWTIVLDDDLSFLFSPIENPFKQSGVMNTAGSIEGNVAILSWFKSQRLEESPNYLRYYDRSGNLLKEKAIKEDFSEVYQDDTDFLKVYSIKTGKISTIHPTTLDTKGFFYIENNLKLHKIDVDGNGVEEFLGIPYNGNRIYVYSNGFEDSAIIDLPTSSVGNKFRFGTYVDTDKKTKIWIQNFGLLYTLTYKSNPLYTLKYVIYIGVYLALTLLVWLIMKVQSLQEEKKRKIERQIAGLQLKTLKNQLDPHFVFNAMNTISEMTLNDNKMEADKYITAFSSLMRKTLKGSDKIAHSLQEELDYIENYIKLQRIRLRNSFDYNIELDNNLDTSQIVPKHVLYTYVENAIKHGLAHHKNKGQLQISATNTDNILKLTVADNGGGLGLSSAKKQHGTGSGLPIMEQIFKLYQERFKKKIKLSFQEESMNDEKGLAVVVTIS